MTASRSLNLIRERFSELTGHSHHSLWSSLFRRKQPQEVILRIRIEWYAYLRADTFIEDLAELAGEEFSFDVVQLVALLYDDFLRQIRLGVELKDLYKRLREKQERIAAARTKIVEDFVQVAENHWSLIKKEVKVKRRMVGFDLRIARKSALRGEVLLYDLSRAAGQTEPLLSLEELITILLLDFVAEIQNGNQTAVMKKIVQGLQAQ